MTTSVVVMVRKGKVLVVVNGLRLPVTSLRLTAGNGESKLALELQDFELDISGEFPDGPKPEAKPAEPEVVIDGQPVAVADLRLSVCGIELAPLARQDVEVDSEPDHEAEPGA